MPFSHTVVKAAARSGRLTILQLVLSKHSARPRTLSHYAARSGSISMLKWLKAQRWCKFDSDTCFEAARGGHLAALLHLRSTGCSWDVNHIACYAANGGSIEVVEWLRQHGDVRIDANTLAWAAGAGQTAMCEHLRSIGCDWGVYACSHAAECDRLDTLRWLRDSGCPWDISAVCMLAAYNDRASILDYLVEKSEVLDAQLLTNALNWTGVGSCLQAAQWLRQHGAQWPAVLGYNEHLQWSSDMIAWAKAEGCTAPTIL
jgi:hypothetical protein